MAKKMATGKRTSSKKSGAGKSSKRGIPLVKATITRGIGFVSTITYTTELKTAFEKGLVDGGISSITFKKKHEIKYEDIGDAVDDLVDDQDVGLIVTCGGLIAYKAAN